MKTTKEEYLPLPCPHCREQTILDITGLAPGSDRAHHCIRCGQLIRFRRRAETTGLGYYKLPWKRLSQRRYRRHLA